MNLPSAYTARMQRMLGPEYPAFLESYTAPRLRGLRVNTRKITPEEFARIAPFPVERIPWIPNGFYYPEEARPAQHPYYAAGLYYLQEPSAMTPAAVLPVKPGDRVLDLCAAPGGKATELAAKLCGEGLLAANDINAARARALLRNLELFGVPNMLVTNETPERLAEVFPCWFDCILADAPCSGEGMFRKDPAVAEVWSPERVRFFAAQQREILAQAYRMLRPGGYLLYSTCTFSPEENEQQIVRFLETHPDMHTVDTGLSDRPEGGHFAPGQAAYLAIETQETASAGILPDAPDRRGWSDALSRCVRIWPHRMRGEGHFLALMQKDGTGSPDGKGCPDSCGAVPEAADRRRGREKKKGKKRTPEELELLRPFTEGLPCRPEEACGSYRLEARGESAYMVQPLPAETAGLHFLRNGLWLGEWKKNRFEPSQALALTRQGLSPDQAFVMPASDERARAYLRGESLALTQEEAGRTRDGWIPVCVDGFPLGWGKKSGQTVKNKYPPSWRQ